jgi:hypothetical protein
LYFGCKRENNGGLAFLCCLKVLWDPQNLGSFTYNKPNKQGPQIQVNTHQKKFYLSVFNPVLAFDVFSVTDSI